MTSLEKHTGRPLVAPWLRGWVDDKPQTTIVWRRYLPVCKGARSSERKQKVDATEFFEHAPPHLSETLEIESYRVLDWLMKRAKILLKDLEDRKQSKPSDDVDTEEPFNPDSAVGFILGHAVDVVAILKFHDLIFEANDPKDNKRRKDRLERNLSNNTLVLDRRLGGLSKNGLLDSGEKSLPDTADDGNVWIEVEDANDTSQTPIPGFRVRESEDAAKTNDPGWRTCFRFASYVSEEGEPRRFLLVDKWKHAAASEDARSLSRAFQELATHQMWAEREARELALRLGIPSQYANMLAVAARLHDEGKGAERWQRAFGAGGDGKLYAKTPSPVKFSLLDGYRHEFGSLHIVQEDPEFQKLDGDLQELCLHLVAAHHGFARPLIRTDGCEDNPPSALEGRARGVAFRFAQLQRRWGPWGLAWWESLIRAAYQRASRDLEAKETEGTNG